LGQLKLNYIDESNKKSEVSDEAKEEKGTDNKDETKSE
jgi:hypothetical protein